MLTFEKGQVVKPQELVGKKGFNICHMSTVGDRVHSVEWFSPKHEAVCINYNDNQWNTVSIEQNYIGLGGNNIAYDYMAWEFLGKGWREKYNYQA